MKTKHTLTKEFLNSLEQNHYINITLQTEQEYLDLMQALEDYTDIMWSTFRKPTYFDDSYPHRTYSKFKIHNKRIAGTTRGRLDSRFFNFDQIICKKPIMYKLKQY